jgi:hypothetical protein
VRPCDGREEAAGAVSELTEFDLLVRVLKILFSPQFFNRPLSYTIFKAHLKKS